MDTPKSLSCGNIVGLAILALAVATIECAARPEFFIRPVVQYTSLTSGGRKSDAKHLEMLLAQPVMNYYSRDYRATKDNAGFGLSAGMSLGQERSYELCLEAVNTTFDGRYETPEYIGVYSASSEGPYTPVYQAASSQKCTFKLTSVMFKFRWKMGKRDSIIRPYLECAGGGYDYTLEEKGRPSGVRQSTFQGDGGNLQVAAGGGIRVNLSRYVDLDIGYNFRSALLSGDDHFNRSAHVVTLGLGGRY